MALYRRAAKRDESEKDIIEALLKTGWSVLRLSVKDGPDLLASRATVGTFCGCGCAYVKCYGRERRTVAIECKTGRRKLKPGQKRWAETWPGETAVIRTAEEALAL